MITKKTYMKMRSKQLTRSQSERLMRVLIVIVFLLLAWYIVSRFVRIVSGPSIVTFVATQTDEDRPAFVKIQGVTKNTETLLINNYPVAPATDGGFEYLFIAQPGVSTIELTAFDKFDNQITKTLTLYTDEPPDSTVITSQPKPPEDTDVESEESLETTNN